MVKIILEKEDIEKLIKEKYDGCEIKAGLSDELEITISMEELPTQTPKKHVPQPMPSEAAKKEVVLKDGSVDANASGLTLENREHTVPGGSMGKKRGQMPVF